MEEEHVLTDTLPEPEAAEARKPVHRGRGRSARASANGDGPGQSSQPSNPEARAPVPRVSLDVS